MRTAGMDFFVGYLGSVTSGQLDGILRDGLAFMPVTYADRFDGPSCVEELRRLEIPSLVTVWLDLEGIKRLTPDEIIVKCNTWGHTVRSAGYDVGIYCGAGFQLTSSELGALTMDRYWLGGSDPVDRNGDLARPFYQGPIGWTMIQLSPLDQHLAGFMVDVDVIQKDLRGRLPLWCVAG
jgi:hypothetical protein